MQLESIRFLKDKCIQFKIPMTSRRSCGLILMMPQVSLTRSQGSKLVSNWCLCSCIQKKSCKLLLPVLQHVQEMVLVDHCFISVCSASVVYGGNDNKSLLTRLDLRFEKMLFTGFVCLEESFHATWLVVHASLGKAS